MTSTKSRPCTSIDDQIVIATTTQHPDDAHLKGLTVTSYELVIVDDWPDTKTVAATARTLSVDPDVDEGWLLTLDDYSADAVSIGEVICDCYDELFERSWDDANERGAPAGRFVIIDDLNTAVEHRGNGYGMSLMTHVVNVAMRNAMFVTWEPNAYEIPRADRATHNETLIDMYRRHTGARPLTDAILILP